MRNSTFPKIIIFLSRKHCFDVRNATTVEKHTSGDMEVVSPPLVLQMPRTRGELYMGQNTQKIRVFRDRHEQGGGSSPISPDR